MTKPENQTKQTKENKAAIDKDTKNGITRPKAGTKTGIVWELADKISAKNKEEASRKEVLAACEKKNLNPATAATQYGRWRKYYGLKGTGTPAKAKATATA